MEDSAKLLTPPTNFAVVQLPGRRYPGVVVQGDTLGNTVRRFERMKVLLEAGELAELADEIDDMHEQFSDVLSGYKLVCAKYSIS